MDQDKRKEIINSSETQEDLGVREDGVQVYRSPVYRVNPPFLTNAVSATRVPTRGNLRKSIRNISRKSTGIPLKRSSVRAALLQVCTFPLW